MRTFWNSSRDARSCLRDSHLPPDQLHTNNGLEVLLDEWRLILETQTQTLLHGILFSVQQSGWAQQQSHQRWTCHSCSAYTSVAHEPIVCSSCTQHRPSPICWRPAFVSVGPLHYWAHQCGDGWRRADSWCLMSDLMVSVLTRFQLYASGMNEESFERNPLNVGFLYIKKSKMLLKWWMYMSKKVSFRAFHTQLIFIFGCSEQRQPRNSGTYFRWNI